jgi:hypothetical protein
MRVLELCSKRLARYENVIKYLSRCVCFIFYFLNEVCPGNQQNYDQSNSLLI